METILLIALIPSVLVVVAQAHHAGKVRGIIRNTQYIRVLREMVEEERTEGEIDAFTKDWLAQEFPDGFLKSTLQGLKECYTSITFPDKR